MPNYFPLVERSTARRWAGGMKRLEEDEDREFPEALHIDLRYVFNGSDLGMEELLPVHVPLPLSILRDGENNRFCDL